MGTTILAYSRFTGEPLALVQSATDPNVRHVVTMGGTCSCKSFTYRNRCRHLGPASPAAPKIQLLRYA